MAASDFISTVQGMYVAYYGRFADQTGLTYWSQQLDASKGNLTQIVDSFGSSTEATGIYGSLSNDAKIEALYQNLFGHAADAAGKAYYAGLLTAGTATASDIAKRILDGAAGNDQLVLGSKIAAANNLTNTVDPLFYAGDAAATAARTLITGVTSPATAAAATAAAFSAAVEGIVNPPAPTEAPVTPAVTESLTAGRDSVKGGAADDYFFATEGTLTAFDVVAAGAGNDMLSVAVSANTNAVLTGFKTTDLETIEVKALGTGTTTLDMADVNMTAENKQTAVTVATRESADARTINVTNIQDIGMTNIKIEDTAATHNFDYDSQADQDNGTETEMQLIENRGTTINFATEGGNSEVTSMKLTSTRDIENARNDVVDLNVGTAFKTMTVSGDASLRIQATTDASLVTVDASAHDIVEATAPMFTVAGYDATAAVAATTALVADSALNCYVESSVAATAAVAAPTFALVMDMSAANAAVNFKGSQDSTAITFVDNTQTKTITTFGGNDGIIAAAGTNTIDSGAGNDTVVSGTGADNITTGAGDDRVTDAGGNNTVSMGDGNDSLTLLDVTSQTAETMGSTVAYTTISSSVSGATTTTVATKTVTVTPDGLSNRGDNSIDMGAGNDSITMQAKELSVADTITGGEGTDTLVLTNASTNLAAQTTPVRDANADAAALASWGTVGATELQRTTSIEKYDLRDSSITLQLGNLNFSTADNNSVTVSTTKATGTQSVDLTAVTAPTYSVTLAGGANKDIVTVGDSFFNGMSTLDFGGTIDLGVNTVIDTLRVVTTNGAQIRQADLDKISGLERMEFAACCGTAQNWSIELTDAFLNRITDTRVGCTTAEPAGTDPSTASNVTLGVQGEFVIYVDPNVPAGSKLTIDASKLSAKTDWAATDVTNGVGEDSATGDMNDIKVTVIGNNNVSINVINDAAARVNVVATSTDFTANGDNLQGTAGDDVFTATSLNQLNQSDIANGQTGGTDTLSLGFGVYQAATELSSQLEDIVLQNIEVLTFNDTTDAANSGVQFTYTTNHDATSTTGKTDSLMTFNLSGHADTMTINANNTAARTDADGRTINTRDGNDTVNVNNSGDVTVNGGTGTDLVTGDSAANTITTIDVETINTNAGADDVVIAATNTVNVTINTGTENDLVTIATGNTGTLTMNGAAGVDTLTGSANADTVTVTSVEMVRTGAGDDTITVTAGLTRIAGEAGNDKIALGTDTQVVEYGTESAHTTNAMTVSSAVDTVTNFQAGHVAGTEDYIDLSNLLTLAVGQFVDLKVYNAGVPADLTGGSTANVGVAWNVQGSLTDITADSGNYFYSNTTESTKAIAKIENNGEAVIAWTNDADGDNVASVQLIYVADTDASSGQNWVVTDLGTVAFDYNIGLNAGTLNDNFVVNGVNSAAAIPAASTTTGAGYAEVAGVAPTTPTTPTTPGTTTAAVAVSAAGTNVDSDTVSTTYTVTAGTYTYTINNFGAGDKLSLFANAALTFASDVNTTDGQETFTVADSSNNTVTIVLTGLTQAEEDGLFNMNSLNAVFGAGTVA